MVRVRRKGIRADSWMCYASFALILGENNGTSAAGIQQVICDNFPSRSKYVHKFSLAAVLSSPENSDLVSKMAPYPYSYALTPEFYGLLVTCVESEAKSILDLRGRPYDTEAGVMWLYERMRGSRLLPTLPSVFRQARDSLRNSEGKE